MNKIVSIAQGDSEKIAVKFGDGRGRGRRQARDKGPAKEKGQPLQFSRMMLRINENSKIVDGSVVPVVSKALAIYPDADVLERWRKAGWSHLAFEIIHTGGMRFVVRASKSDKGYRLRDGKERKERPNFHVPWRAPGFEVSRIENPETDRCDVLSASLESAGFVDFVVPASIIVERVS